MTRTTAEVIADLDAAVTEEDGLCDVSQTALVVAFTHESKMIFHGDRDRLNRLNNMVQNGGCPLGFIKVYTIGKEISIVSKMLPEFENDENACNVIRQLCISAGKTISFGEKHT